MMKSGNSPLHDVDMKARAIILNGKANVLQQGGFISADERKQCFNLRQLDELVRRGETAMLTALTPAPAETATDAPLLAVEVMQARFSELEKMLATADNAQVFESICAELTELQAEIEKQHGAMDDRYDGRLMARNLSDTF